jgi:hypothetical protein
MIFADKVLVRLADPAARAGLFDDIALEQFAAAAYDTSRITLQGPYSAAFDEVQLGLAIPRRAIAEGQWGPIGTSEKTIAEFQMAGLAGASMLVDAFWRGYIIARTSAPTGRIAALTTTWPDPSAIDREIVAALGALPADPAVLETERRKRLIDKFKAAVSEPAVVTDDLIDRLLRAAHTTSVNEFFDRASRESAVGPVRITISEGPPPPPPSPKPLPVAAAILVRDVGFAVGQLLADSRMVREQLEAAAQGRPDDPTLHPLRGVLVIWIVPQAVFLDADWPGADAAERRRAAGAWLAREGVGLATVA